MRLRLLGCLIATWYSDLYVILYTSSHKHGTSTWLLLFCRKLPQFECMSASGSWQAKPFICINNRGSKQLKTSFLIEKLRLVFIQNAFSNNLWSALVGLQSVFSTAFFNHCPKPLNRVEDSHVSVMHCPHSAEEIHK